MGDDVRPDHLADPGQETHHPGRHAGRGQTFDEHGGHRRGLLGRLEDHRVAGDQRGGHHARGDGEGEVPRRDHHAHSPGLVGEPVRLSRW